MHEVPKERRDVTPQAAEQYRLLTERTSTLIERLRLLRQQSVEIRSEIQRHRESQRDSRDGIKRGQDVIARRPA